jgi:hypothetical protein
MVGQALGVLRLNLRYVKLSRRMKAKPPILRLYRGVLVMSLMSLIAENQTRRLNANTDISSKQD